jgi:hypothetical protein
MPLDLLLDIVAHENDGETTYTKLEKTVQLFDSPVGIKMHPFHHNVPVEIRQAASVLKDVKPTTLGHHLNDSVTTTSCHLRTSICRIIRFRMGSHVAHFVSYPSSSSQAEESLTSDCKYSSHVQHAAKRGLPVMYLARCGLRAG